MAFTVDTTATPTYTRAIIKFTDVRGQTARLTVNFGPLVLDTTIQSFLTHLDNLTNAALTVDIEKVWLPTGGKAAVDAVEANLSEVMMIVLQATNPITGSGKVSGKLPIYAMVRAAENFPSGTLNTGNADVSGLNTILNASYSFKASDNSYHVGLLQVQPLDSQHVTEEDLVDTF